MSLGGKYLFATVMCLVLMALCVISVWVYGGVVGYLCCFGFLCEFGFLYCDDVRLGDVYSVFRFLNFVSDAVYVDLKYNNVFFLCLIVVCEWLGGDLSAMGCCVVCAWCVYGVSPVRFVLSLFYMCAIQMNPVCVVCVVTSD